MPAVCGVKHTNPTHHALHAGGPVGSSGAQHSSLLEKQEGSWILQQQVIMSRAAFM